jgi:hypothetical protein
MGRALRKSLELMRGKGVSQAFGVILEAEAAFREPLGRLLVRRDNTAKVTALMPHTVDFSTLPGRIVTLEKHEGRLMAALVEIEDMKKMAYIQLVEVRTGSVIDEFPYPRRAEAEGRLRALEIQYPGQYKTRQDSRWE